MEKRKSRTYEWKREVLKGGRRKSAQKGVPKELRLLCRIYNMSAADMTQLLPQLVDDDGYPMVNYELHLLLATIVSNYIDSWYPKLNLEDMEFITEVYSTMTNVVSVIVYRIKSLDNMALVNKIASMLTQHMKDIENLNQQKLNIMGIGNVNSTLDPVKLYLKQQHQIFADIRYETEDDFLVGDNNIEDTTAFGLDIKTTETLERDYLRLLSKNVLDCIFAKQQQSPISSQLVERLLVAIIGDLVLKKTLDKLSEPDFVYDTLGVILSKWDKEGEKDKKGGKERKEAEEEVRGEANQGPNKNFTGIEDSFSMWQLILGYFKSGNSTKEKNSNLEPILMTPIFQLINQITKFSTRRPLAYGIFEQVRMIMSKSYYVDKQLKKFITGQILQLPVLLDQGLSRIVSLTTSILFNQRQETGGNNKNNDNDNNSDSNSNRNADDQRKEESTSDVTLRLAESILKILDERVKYLRYSGESKQELLNSITETLETFSDPTINRALTIKLIDSLICSLFPELLEEHIPI